MMMMMMTQTATDSRWIPTNNDQEQDDHRQTTKKPSATFTTTGTGTQFPTTHPSTTVTTGTATTTTGSATCTTTTTTSVGEPHHAPDSPSWASSSSTSSSASTVSSASAAASAAAAAAMYTKRPSCQEYHLRQMKVEALQRDAARIWPTLTEHEQQHDKELILAALQSSTLPPKADFERKFTQALRFDRDVVLAFLARHDFPELYQSRHLFVPGCLTNDKQVMMAYCQQIPRSLQECSEELIADRQVVQAAITLDGLELQYASLSLQQDKELIVQACQQHGRALEFCPPGPIRDELTSNREFMKQVLMTPGGGTMLKLAPEPLRKDPELILLALTHGMAFRQVPQDLLLEPTFVLEAVSRKSTLYLEMTATLQRHFAVALAAVVAPDSTPDVHKRAIAHCPSLTSNRNAVLAFCQRGDKEFLEHLLETTIFRNDKEIMMYAIARDARLFAVASDTLRQDPDIILVSIQESTAWNTIKTVPWTIQRQHPQITIKAIQFCCSRNLRYLPAHLPEDLWNNRDIVLAWIQRGGRVLDAFERMLTRDTELALALAQYNWSEFHKVGDVFTTNRDFMLQAVQRDGRVLRFASSNIRQDFEVLVHAVANHKETLVYGTASASAAAAAITVTNDQLGRRSTTNGFMDPRIFAQRVEEKLQLYHTFVYDFLRGIAIGNQPHIPPARRSQLHMLDRGVETSQAFKRLIALYLGVPIGAELALLRRAWNNIQQQQQQLQQSSSSSTPAVATSSHVASRPLPPIDHTWMLEFPHDDPPHPPPAHRQPLQHDQHPHDDDLAAAHDPRFRSRRWHSLQSRVRARNQLRHQQYQDPQQPEQQGQMPQQQQQQEQQQQQQQQQQHYRWQLEHFDAQNFHFFDFLQPEEDGELEDLDMDDWG